MCLRVFIAFRAVPFSIALLYILVFDANASNHDFRYQDVFISDTALPHYTLLHRQQYCFASLPSKYFFDCNARGRSNLDLSVLSLKKILAGIRFGCIQLQPDHQMVAIYPECPFWINPNNDFPMRKVNVNPVSDTPNQPGYVENILAEKTDKTEIYKPKIESPCVENSHK